MGKTKKRLEQICLMSQAAQKAHEKLSSIRNHQENAHYNHSIMCPNTLANIGVLMEERER